MQTQQIVEIDYTNWRGERRKRPVQRSVGSSAAMNGAAKSNG